MKGENEKGDGGLTGSGARLVSGLVPSVSPVESSASHSWALARVVS